MYTNERDQINYCGFLRALREMNQVSQQCVCRGICTVSGMNRFENGNRVAEKLMRDRLTARLGISGEKYEDYLKPREYVVWQQRLRIIKAIEKGKLSKAKKELEEYGTLPDLNCLNKQFVETMRFIIMEKEGVADDVLFDSIKKAIKYTIPNVAKALKGSHLLSDQEINLIAEMIRFDVPKKVIRDDREWRIAEYEKLIDYIEKSSWETLQKAKVYPKLVHHISQLLQKEDMTEAECRRGLELCHNAIELLRDSSRLYYFIELTEARRKFAETLISNGVASSEKAELEEMLGENNEWERVFKELYAEYKIHPYMTNFCYLYYENECHDVVEVIETRRNMLGLSRVKLSEGICTERTIVRFEREGKNPTISLIRLLFAKLGLCAEYRRARVITTDVEALLLVSEVIKNMNNREFEKWQKNLERLTNKLNMNIPHNKQEISRLQMILKYRMKEIDFDELYRNFIGILEYTLPIEGVYKKKLHLTRSEITCLFDLAFKGRCDLSERCVSLISDRYGKIEKGIPTEELCIYEFILDGYVSYLGNLGMYEESSKKSEIVLKECLIHRRLEVIANNLYNILWNKQSNASVEYKRKVLGRCLLISILNKSSYRIAFFQDKLDDI